VKEPPIPLAFRLLHRFERYLARHSPLGDPPVYDSADFPWVPQLRAHCAAITAEYRALLAGPEPIPPFHEISPEQLPITSDAGWRTFVLYAYGVEARRNCALCPRTAAAVRAIPGMQTAMFSILEPGKRLPPHRGPYKGLLRVHLALEVPGDGSACWIDLAGHRLHWRAGEVLVFDDTFVHSAANASAGRRCVLFLDILRPLDAGADRVNRGLLAVLRASPFGHRARGVFRRWYRRHGIEADA
jgi:aspartyl/asparaginyl beta-hydroxylase (cupin superfamily)